MRSKRRRELREKNQNGRRKSSKSWKWKSWRNEWKRRRKIFNSSPRRGSTSCKRKCKRRWKKVSPCKRRGMKSRRRLTRWRRKPKSWWRRLKSQTKEAETQRKSSTRLKRSYTEKRKSLRIWNRFTRRTTRVAWMKRNDWKCSWQKRTLRWRKLRKERRMRRKKWKLSKVNYARNGKSLTIWSSYSTTPRPTRREMRKDWKKKLSPCEGKRTRWRKN